MKLKFGTLLLCAASVATMSAQTPTAVQEIYSQTGSAKLASGTEVVYSFGNWHAGSDASLLSPLFEQMIADANDSPTFVEGVNAEIDGILVSWNSVDKQITVKCNSDKLGRTSVLIATLDGATRGMETVNESPAVISLSDYTPGVYAVAVAVDGKLIKTLKITLK